MMMFDTSFLIDLQREWLNEERGRATRFLRDHASEQFRVSTVAILEFLEGYDVIADGERFLEPFEWVDVTPGVARKASRVRRSLRQAGTMIGDFDIVIAAAALETESPLVSGNASHFQLVKGLRVIEYR
jgi:predicted nucleic acid-binding protein